MPGRRKRRFFRSRARRPDPARRAAPGAGHRGRGLCPGRVGCAVADAATGEMLEVFNALYPLPPASVAKAVTTAYGLDRLGPDYRFRTTLLADG
jgi:D-alanyl-D-alanine carboxypeptidase/D-alanyl-D-alanine-endopeptidase (penicillin-binding protein 4)